MNVDMDVDMDVDVGGATDLQLEILLVEDNPDDVRLTEEVLAEGDVHGRLSVVTDGEQALDFLHQRGRFAAAPRPSLILLDLKLPRLDGHAVLAEISQTPALQSIPVVVLTSSTNAHDLLRAQELRCSCYVNKPTGMEEFSDLVDVINFWLGVAGPTAKD